MTDHHFCSLIAAASLLAVPLVARAQSDFKPSPSTAPVEPVPGMLPVPMSMSGMATRFDPNRKLQPGDQLSFKIEQDKDPAVPVIVSPSGDLTIEPLTNSVHVQGMTPAAAAADIKRELEKDYYYTATVRLNLEKANAQATMGYIYLSGNVSRIGAMPIFQEQPMTISQVILSAGGFSRWADDRRVQVTRTGPNGTQSFKVDLKAVIKGGHPELDMPALAGDRIFVPETSFKFD